MSSPGTVVMTRHVITRNAQGNARGVVMETEVWILGGTGRSGRVIATELMARGLTPVLVGRDATRLAQAAQATAQTASEATFDTSIQPRTLVAASIDDMAAAIQ